MLRPPLALPALLLVLLLPPASTLASGCRHDDAPAGAPPSGSGSTAPPPSSATAPGVPVDAGETVVGIEDEGKTLELARGAVLTVKLALSSGTGFSWVPAAADGGVLELEGERASQTPASTAAVSSASPMPGSARFDVYRFVARTPGTTTLALELRRPWEHDVPPARSFHVTVRVP
jgi:inhibitor of cysteine peptidase